jgi:putative hemolysin
MEVAAEIAIILLLILINGLFSMTEMALVSVRRARLAVLERKGVKGAARARALAETPQRFLPTLQVGITLVGILSGVFGGARIAQRLAEVIAQVPFLAHFAETIAFLIIVLAITYLTMVIGELVPKQLALRRPEQIAARMAGVTERLALIATPMVWLLNTSSTAVLRLLGMTRVARQTVTEEELKALLAEGTQAGVLETEERDMIERVLRLADKPVRAIMTPRNELAWIDRTDPARDIAQTLKSAPHSRFVVCDGSIDNVVGIVQAKDILDRILGGGDLSVAAALRQPMVVPDTVTALDALERLKTDALGIALVMDEYGSFEGVVTAADLLQAIIGEPWAETVRVEQPAAGEAAGTGRGDAVVVDGMMPLDELKDRLALPDLPAEGSYHTAGGLLLALLRRVPQEGDRIVFGGWRFEVLSMDGRRVDRLRALREPLAES